MAESITIGVLTSGGDAPGMNAALRSVVRTALSRNTKVYAIYEGYQGAIEGGGLIRQMSWDDVGGIIQRGGTEIGTARCASFQTREGRLKAARNLVERGINRLVIIGGDGSLTGATIFQQEWTSLIAELVEKKEISPESSSQYPFLGIIGLVGSIDNDMCGTDMTIGADSALHRITSALDSLSSTAASHHRTFVVEVMGRNCGYLALMGAVSGGADWVIIPECPPESEDWEKLMCDSIYAGRLAGRRESIVVVAEGAQDRNHKPITSNYIRKVLEEKLGVDTRVTILGHVQRGGTPSGFDRWMSTLLGYSAVEKLLTVTADCEPQLVGMHNNRVIFLPLKQCVEQTHTVAKEIYNGNYDQVMALRGGSFREMYQTFQSLTQALPPEKPIEHTSYRIALMNAGAPASGMNTATQVAVRLGIHQGHTMLGVRNGFTGLIEGAIEEFTWGSVDGWGRVGGAELGTSLNIPSGHDFYAIARSLEKHKINALMIIGGWDAYEATYKVYLERQVFESFNIPVIFLPASIDNNLPGSELSIGADTALNSIIEVVDKIKQSAVAARRCFVVEVMGGNCGYLALMSGLATGAERVYLPEQSFEMSNLQADLTSIISGFKNGKRLSLVIRNENSNRLYTTDFLCALFEEENKGLFDVRKAVLGHLQEGGNPSPFDRIQATRMAARCIDSLIGELDNNSMNYSFIGFKNGKVEIINFEDMAHLADFKHRRPRHQWWLELEPVAHVLAQPRTAKWSVIQGGNKTPALEVGIEEIEFIGKRVVGVVRSN